MFALDAFILLGIAHSFHGELRRELRVSGSTARTKIYTNVGINKLDDPLGSPKTPPSAPASSTPPMGAIDLANDGPLMYDLICSESHTHTEVLDWIRRNLQ